MGHGRLRGGLPVRPLREGVRLQVLPGQALEVHPLRGPRGPQVPLPPLHTLLREEGPPAHPRPARPREAQTPQGMQNKTYPVLCHRDCMRAWYVCVLWGSPELRLFYCQASLHVYKIFVFGAFGAEIHDMTANKIPKINNCGGSHVYKGLEHSVTVVLGRFGGGEMTFGTC